jgi:hypothetical protein
MKRIKVWKINTCMPIFISALLPNHPRCPSTDEWVKKMLLYVHEYYSAPKKNESLSL